MQTSPPVAPQGKVHVQDTELPLLTQAEVLTLLGVRQVAEPPPGQSTVALQPLAAVASSEKARAESRPAMKVKEMNSFLMGRILIGG